MLFPASSTGPHGRRTNGVCCMASPMLKDAFAEFSARDTKLSLPQPTSRAEDTTICCVAKGERPRQRHVPRSVLSRNVLSRNVLSRKHATDPRYFYRYALTDVLNSYGPGVSGEINTN
jgi:hypothetical protein